MNYFDLVETIKTVSLRYSQEFYEGDVYEFLNSGNHKYPSVILTVQNITTDDNINSVSATLFCVDRLTDNADNKLEIQSLCMTNLSKIIDSLEDKITNLTANTYTPFTEKFADLCGGMFVEFSLQYVSEDTCFEGVEIKEIELTQNGIYDVIGYDRAIVNVRPVVNLEDITITDNGEYTPSEDFDGFGKVNVDLSGKVKLLKISNTSGFISNTCVDENGRWLGDEFIDTSLCTEINFNGMTKLKYLNCSNWDTSNCVNLSYFLRQCTSIENIDVSNFNTSNVKRMGEAFRGCKMLKMLDLKNWDMSSVTDFLLVWCDCPKLESLIGYTTLEEVLEKNISCMNGLSVCGGQIFSNSTNLDRASLRALINGLAEVETTQTLTLGATLRAKLTEEDIAIATAKNWTIA